MSQPHPSQHLAVSNMQFWQQKLLYNQLQDLQRQQQLQQLENGSRQQNLLNQLSASTKPVTLNQPAMINEMPIHNVPNYMRSNNFVGAVPQVSGNSHMFVAGSMNRPNLASSPAMHNDVIVYNNQSPSTRSTGYFPDQSLHDISISSSRSSTIHYSQLSEMSNDGSNLMTKEVGSQSEKVSGQFNSSQKNDHFVPQSCLKETNLGSVENFQGKGFFGHASVEMLNNDDSSANFRRINDVQCGLNQFNVRQEQPDWSGSMQEKPAEQVGTSKYVASLDPTEQKILFGMDDDNWGASLSGNVNSGAGGFLQGLPLANDYLGGFPSIQSGSWSALMQEAVQVSTSDKEAQEEWSGLDFQNMEQSILKASLMSSGSDKHLAASNDRNLQVASLTTKPLTLLNDTDAGPSLCNAPTFQPSFGISPAEHNSAQGNSSRLSFQLSSRHTNDNQFHQVQKQNQLQEVVQVQTPENNEMWMGQTYQWQENSSSDMQHIQDGWIQHQDSHMSNIGGRASNRPSDWNSNYQGRVGNSKFSDDGNMQNFPTIKMNTGVRSVGDSISQDHSEGSFMDNYGCIPTLNNDNQQKSSQKVAFGKSFSLDSCINSEGDRNVKNGHNQQSVRHQSWEFLAETANERLDDNSDNNKIHPKVVSGEGYVSNMSYGHRSNIIKGEKEISSLINHDKSESVVNTSSSLFHQSSGIQGFGLQLAPPTHWQQHSHFALSSQMSINDKNSRQLNQEAGDNDHMASTYTHSRRSLPSSEVSERENLYKISDEMHKEASESEEQLRPPVAAVSGPTYLTNDHQQEIYSGKTLLHQQHHKQTISSSGGHEVSRPSVEFPLGNQTDEHTIKNSSTQWKSQDSHDRVVTGQSTPASLLTPVREILPSRLVPFADTHLPANSKSPSLVSDDMKKMVAGFPQVQNSGPFAEGRSGLQPSVTGTVKQAGFSRMLQNVWSNISTQQRLAGLHPAKLTPQLLQYIINNNRDTSSWSLQKGDDQGSKGQPQADMDSALKTVTSSQGEEVAQRTSGGGSNISVSSLVRLHQQDMDRGKGGHDAAAHFQAVNTSMSTMSSRSSEIGFSGNASMSLDARQQNYSLLHQMQAMKGSHSDPRKMLGKNVKDTDYTSNAPHMHWSASQKSAYVQNPSFRVPADCEVNASSQGAFSSDVKMLGFGSKHNVNISSTSATTIEEHGLQNSLQAYNTTSVTDFLLGTEQTQSGSQMAPSWFEKYGNYKSGAVSSNSFNGQPSDGYEIILHGKDAVPANVVTSKISSFTLRPIDNMMAPRSNKRKRTILRLPWHKLVTEGSHRLLSISTGELDWAQAANRLIEKVGDESETVEDNSSVVQSRRRLILTTQLAQQLLPAVPARILRDEATSSYESMTFCVAQGVLADACGMLSLPERYSGANLEHQNWTTKKVKASMVEDFMERSNNLESDFLRLENTTLLDVRFECQELERFSIVNRLGKFHGRSHVNVVEDSNSEATSRRTLLQRYVTALPPPESLPEGIVSLNLM